MVAWGNLPLDPFSVLGAFASRLETDQNTGTCHLLEQMAFKSTNTRSHQQVSRQSVNGQGEVAIGVSLFWG